MLDFDIVALDTETSSLDSNNGTLLSLAMIVYTTGESVNVGFRHPSLTLTPEAMRVNQLDVTQLDSPDRMFLDVADTYLKEWLTERCRRPIAMGLNIGSFDLLWIQKHLPQLGIVLGFRTLDLNALLYAKAVEMDKTFRASTKFAYDKATEMAIECYPEFRQHDALSDTYFNCMVLELMTGVRFGGWKE